MALKCPHCSFDNGDMAAYCGQCLRPLRASRPPVRMTDRQPLTDPERTVISSPPPRHTTGELATSPMPPNFGKNRVRRLHDPIALPDFKPQAHEAPTVVKPTPVQEGDDTPVRPSPRNRVEARREALAPPPAPVPTKAPLPRTRRPEPQTQSQQQDEITEKKAQPLPTDDAAEMRRPRPRPQLQEDLLVAPRESEVVEPTVIPTRSGSAGRLLAALGIDLALALLAGALAVTAELALFGARTPGGEGTGLDLVAGFVHQVPGLVQRAVAAMLLCAWLHTVWGGRTGYTLGRSLMGLVTVRTNGELMGLVRACMRAVLALASVAVGGAGYFWMVVDGQQRSLHDLACGTLTVRRTMARL